MGIKKDYEDAAVNVILQMNPSYDKHEVRKIVASMMKERFSDPTIDTDNNVTGETAQITFTELCKWIECKKPVISGNATFYCQPSEQLSPSSNMLRSLKRERKAIKTEMFSYPADSDEYSDMDLDQNNKKVIMNAEYGGSGTPTAAFYTKYSPPATTLMAQSIITTMAAFFEGFIGDRQVFFHINECYDWMNHVLRKTDPIPKWVLRPAVQQVSRRIKCHFYMADPTDFPFLDQFLSTCTKDQLTYLYYANNLNGFVRDHPNVQELIREILTELPSLDVAEKGVPEAYQDRFHGKDEYNRWVSAEMFLNPYKPPKVIQEPLNALKKIIKQMIYVEYLTPDSIVKLNNHKRNTVLLVDTDSNIINADLFVSFILNEIFPHVSFNRIKLYNEMICVNILASLLDGCVAGILDFYGRCHNMDEASRAELTMKNEFMFRLFFIMLVKKRYAASIVRREGTPMIPFKAEIKGMDFIKAGVTEEVSERFTKMLKDYILFSDELNLHGLMAEIKRFEQEIDHDLKRGGTKFLKPQQYKAAGAYAQGRSWSLPVFRGVQAWNALYPKKKIYSLDRVRVVKMVIRSVSDLERIRSQYPDDYQNIMTHIYHSPDPNLQKSGVQYLAIPPGTMEVPGWAVELEDRDVIISDVISSFRSVLDALEIEPMKYKTPSGTAKLTSCLISL